MHLESAVHQVAQPVRVFYLWPEHADAFDIFKGCGTQWHSGFDGRTGLDYAGREIVMRQHSGRVSGHRPRRRAQLLQQLQILEVSALNAWQQERNNNK